MHPYSPSYYNHLQTNARALVGCAVGHTYVGTAEDIRLARRAVGRAIQFYMASGMTQAQAINEVIALAQLLGGLE